MLTLVCAFVAAGQEVRSVAVQAVPANYRGPCPATITFTGKIRMSGPGEVRYVWRRTGGDARPAQTIVFPAPGELEVTDTWEVGAPAVASEMRFEGLRVLSPQLRDSAGAWFSVQCQGQEPEQGQAGGQGQRAGEGDEAGQGQAANRRPDLTVTINIPRPGDARPRAFLIAHNIGLSAAAGTDGTPDTANGYMVDVVLSTDRQVPAEPAIFSPNFSEDVMIRGGRVSRTYDLPARASRPYSLNVEIPADTPAGNYFLCARIDPFNKVAESVEANNTACAPFIIRPRQ